MPANIYILMDLHSTVDFTKEKALKKYYSVYFQKACNYAMNFIGSEDIAADIVQDVFIGFWKKSLKLPNTLVFKSYLYNSIRNACINYIRDNKSVSADNLTENTAETEKNIEHLIIENEIQGILLEAINKLPEVRQKIMIMRIKGMAFADIAFHLGLSMNTVKTHKKLAHKQLKEELKENSFIFFIFFSSLG